MISNTDVNDRKTITVVTENTFTSLVQLKSTGLREMKSDTLAATVRFRVVCAWFSSTG